MTAEIDTSNVNEESLSWILGTSVEDPNFKAHFKDANLETLLAPQATKGITQTKKRLIEGKIKRLKVQEQTFDFENNMTESEARAKHDHLKSLLNTTRAIGNDINDHFDSLNGLNYGYGDGEANHLLPLYPLTDNTKFYLSEIARVLRNSASTIDFLLNYDNQKPLVELDHIDESAQSLGDFFLKWKKFRQENPTAGNDYDWWFSRLMEEKSTRLKKHLSNFKAVWERYENEIRATDVEVV